MRTVARVPCSRRPPRMRRRAGATPRHARTSSTRRSGSAMLLAPEVVERRVETVDLSVPSRRPRGWWRRSSFTTRHGTKTPCTRHYARAPNFMMPPWWTAAPRTSHRCRRGASWTSFSHRAADAHATGRDQGAASRRRRLARRGDGERRRTGRRDGEARRRRSPGRASASGRNRGRAEA